MRNKCVNNYRSLKLSPHPSPLSTPSILPLEYNSKNPTKKSWCNMDAHLGPNEEEPTSWEDLVKINLLPSELFLKFRKEIQGIRLGANLEFYNAPYNDFHPKLVLKPLAPERKWKFMYEPIHQDVHLISKKIPLTNFLSLQVGIGHNFHLHETGWKWKLTTCFGGDGFSRIRNKTTLGLCPGVDFRFRWRADYVLPEITGALGTGDPLFKMKAGQLQASLDRVEAIFTHKASEEAIFTHKNSEVLL